ncbi:MAG TPA: hypothetical protein VGN14_15500 [Candidatus Elarobacter sp.]|jgi:hypothetical protein
MLTESGATLKRTMCERTLAALRRIFALTAFVAAPGSLGAVASAEPLPPVRATFCGEALNYARVVRAVAGDAPNRQALDDVKGATVDLEHEPGFVTVQLHSRVMRIASVPTLWADCGGTKNGSAFATATSLPGGIVADLAAVFAYRERHRWPTEYGAYVEYDDTTLFLEDRGAYQFVSIIDGPDRHRSTMPNGDGVIDSCRYAEYYRVDTRTFDVLPYNGCLVGGALLKMLPDALHLPK